MTNSYVITLKDDAAIEAEAIFRAASISDNPTVRAAWDALQTAVLLTNSDLVAREIKWLNANAHRYSDDAKELLRLRTKLWGNLK